MEPRSDQIVGRDKTVTTVVDRRRRVVRPPPLWRSHRSNFVLNIGNVSSHADRVSEKKGCQKQSNKRYFFLVARWNHLLRSARTTFRSAPDRVELISAKLRTRCWNSLVRVRSRRTFRDDNYQSFYFSCSVRIVSYNCGVDDKPNPPQTGRKTTGTRNRTRRARQIYTRKFHVSISEEGVFFRYAKSSVRWSGFS